MTSAQTLAAPRQTVEDGELVFAKSGLDPQAPELGIDDGFCPSAEGRDDRGFERCCGCEAAFRAEMMKPVRADAHVADLLAQDHVENGGGALVAMLAELPDQPRG